MTERGLYVSIFRAIWHDPDHKKLNIETQHLLYYLLSHPDGNMCGIFEVWHEPITKRAKIPPKTIEYAMKELEKGKDPWIMRDGNLVWVRNALKFNPGYSIKNENHRKSIKRQLEGLPPSLLISQFLNYYKGLGYFDQAYLDTIGNTIPNGIPNGIGNHEDETETEDESENKTEDENEVKPGKTLSYDDEIALYFSSISDSDIAEWMEAYPAVDIEGELRRARQWLISNPAKKKKQFRRFITNWLGRCQEKGGSYGEKKRTGASGQGDYPEPTVIAKV